MDLPIHSAIAVGVLVVAEWCNAREEISKLRLARDEAKLAIRTEQHWQDLYKSESDRGFES